jgi:hypothetical protein
VLGAFGQQRRRVKYSIIYLINIALVSACTTSGAPPKQTSNDEQVHIEEELISQAKTQDTDQKKVTVYQSGIDVLDLLEFASERYLDSEIVEEKAKTAAEDAKQHLPSGSRVNNP